MEGEEWEGGNKEEELWTQSTGEIRVLSSTGLPVGRNPGQPGMKKGELGGGSSSDSWKVVQEVVGHLDGTACSCGRSSWFS